MAKRLTGLALLAQTNSHPAVIIAKNSKRNHGLGYMEEDTPKFEANMNSMKAKIKRSKLSLKKDSPDG